MAASSQGLVEVVQGDITALEADAIVNAANSALKAGGGVCGAIFRAAGANALTQACDAIGHCPTGEAALTPAFGIKTARCIIHAVGPVYSAYPPEKARELLRSAYQAAIRLAAAQGCRSIAFPAISTGIVQRNCVATGSGFAHAAWRAGDSLAFAVSLPSHFAAIARCSVASLLNALQLASREDSSRS